jgi:hypothetical protein
VEERTADPGDVDLLLTVLTPRQNALHGMAVNLSLEFCYSCCPNSRDKELEFLAI